MRNLSIDSLRAFVTAADLEGVTAAADHLGRSQPATTLQIQKLEEILGVELFIRQNRRLTLTPAGLIARQYAQKILQLNDQLQSEFLDNPLTGQIRLGIPSEFATTLLPKVISRFAAAYPEINLEVFSDLSRNLLAEDHRHQYDLILALHDKLNTNRHRLIKHDTLVWVGSNKLGPEEIHQQLGRQLLLVLARDGCIYRKRALKQLEKHKIPSRIVHTNPDLTGIKVALHERLGITVLAHSTVDNDMQILNESQYGLPVLGSIDISLQYSKRDASEATLKLASYIKSSLQ